MPKAEKDLRNYAYQERVKYQSYLHRQKKDFITEIAKLLLPPDERHGDTRIVLRAIRLIFEKKFPEMIGKENGCLFRRTVEYNGVRRSIWATADPEKNNLLFLAREYEDKMIKEKCNVSGQTKALKRTADELERADKEKVKAGTQIDDVPNEVGVTNMCVILTECEFQEVLPPRPLTPNLFHAVYPEQRTLFGITSVQQSEYDKKAQEVEAYKPQYDKWILPTSPYQQPSTSAAPADPTLLDLYNLARVDVHSPNHMTIGLQYL